MARIRTTKPEFWTDEKIVNLPYETRLFFMGLWSFADDCGHVEDEPLRLKLQILPNDDVDAKKLIETLISVGIVKRLRGCLSIVNFQKHQKIDRPSTCRFDEDSTKPPRKRRERSESPPSRKGREGNGREGKGASLASNASTREEPPRDEIFEAVARACGINWRNGITKTARGNLNEACKQLRDVNATPTQVRQRAANWPSVFPDATLTPTALAKWWPQLEHAKPPPKPKDRFADMIDREEVPDGVIDADAYPSRRGLPQG